MRKIKEQTRKPSAVALKEYEGKEGPDAFYRRFTAEHPEKELAMVIKHNLPNAFKWQGVSDIQSYKRNGWEVVSEDEKDTWDDDQVWMAIDKSKLAGRRADPHYKPGKFARIGDASIEVDGKGFRFDEINSRMDSSNAGEIQRLEESLLKRQDSDFANQLDQIAGREDAG